MMRNMGGLGGGMGGMGGMDFGKYEFFIFFIRHKTSSKRFKTCFMRPVQCSGSRYVGSWRPESWPKGQNFNQKLKKNSKIPKS